MGFLSSLFGVDKAEDAARNAASSNRKEGGAAYDEALRLFAPYYDTGMAGWNRYADFLGLNGQGTQQQAFDSYVQGPDVQYRVDQGVRAIDNSSAARTGGTLSGGQLKALNKFGIGEATQDYGNFMSRLAGVGAQGQSAAGSLAGARYNTANIVTGANTAEGNAIANANLAGGNILGNIIGGGMKLAGSFFNPFGGGK